MPRKPDLPQIKSTSLSQIALASKRYEECWQKQTDYLLLRWIASMTAVEVYAIWERYAERRLTVALVYHPQKFIEENNIRGLTSVSLGLAAVLVRSGNRYFDFRSTNDLIDKGDRLVGKTDNPFRSLTQHSKDYLNTLGAIRNYIVHHSDSALASYKKYLSDVYSVKSKPKPEEFLNSIDYRPNSPAKKNPRLYGLVSIVDDVIRKS